MYKCLQMETRSRQSTFINKVKSYTLTKTRRCTILTRERAGEGEERAGESELEMREPAKKTDKLKPKILYKPIRETHKRDN